MQDNYFEEKIIKDKKFRNVTKESCKFVDCSFENCLFEECRILNCIFLNCRFENCTVIRLEANYSEIKNGDFQRCHLIGVHWETLFPTGKYARPIESLKNCCLKYNTFADADFRNSSGYMIDIASNKLKQARFSYPEVVRLLNSLEIQIV